MNPASSLKKIVTNITSFAFMINMFATKNIFNTYKKNNVLSIKNMQVKNLAKSGTEYCQNVLHQVKIFK